ncbi:DUF7701 domain-containing protein [Micromonospora palythoicola]
MASEVCGARCCRTNSTLALLLPVPTSNRRENCRMMDYLSSDAFLIRSQIDESHIPPNSNDLFLIYAVLLRAKGESVTAPDVHDAWVAWMRIQGVSHDSSIPFDDLDQETQNADSPFVMAIRRAAALKASHSEQ